MESAQRAASTSAAVGQGWDRATPYDLWIKTLELPVHGGYFVDDIRTLELGWWEERKCSAAILTLAGQEGVSEVRVSEVPAGKSTAPVYMTLDEIVYIADGRGMTTITSPSGVTKNFEWQKHSLFILPRHHTHQFSSLQGDRPARLLHYNSLPMAMTLLPDPDFFFNAKYADETRLNGRNGEEFYSEAKVMAGDSSDARGAYWVGNFFPDMRVWDNLIPFKGRGAGGHVVWIRYPGAPLWNHMSVFPAQSYKKAHRHGPGTLIVIPAGEGFSYMWPEGEEKVFIPWHEASVFVPPNRWFHQHFNVGEGPGRYLAFHSPRGTRGNTERVTDTARDQIEYPQEDPIVRQTFEAEMAKRGMKSAMPDQAYKDPTFEWDYGNDDHA